MTEVKTTKFQKGQSGNPAGSLLTCTKCAVVKPATEFYSKTGRQRKNTRCKLCYREQQNERRRKQRADPAFRQAEFEKETNTPRGRSRKLLGDIRNRCKAKGYEYDLDIDWLHVKIKAGCERTGLPFVLERTGDNTTKPHAPSIDRIDPTLGYTKDNCVVCVWVYNACKNVHTHEDVLEFARALLQHER